MKFINVLVLLSFLQLSVVSASNDLGKEIVVYKNPSCSCCSRWVKYLKGKDYVVIEKNTRDVLAEKKRLGVPEKLAACHTAVIDGYVVEGHVTARDIKRLLLFRPDITGIAVPGMPIGTPGMESSSSIQPYNVMSFDEQGNVKIFQKH